MKWSEAYPRPQLVREDWLSLDGEWKYGADRSETINVPFCVESELSGIGRRLAEGETMVYEREFSLPQSWSGKRIKINFGAVDQVARVAVNGREVGAHEGGYLPFTFDITDAVRFGGEANVLRVEAVDELDHKYPWGKQRKDNGGMWYTPVSGIWKSVWLEPVSSGHITSLRIDPGLDHVKIKAFGISDGTVILTGRRYKMEADGDGVSVRIDIDEPHLWTPDDPYLYEFEIESAGGDRVKSYFAMRTLSIEERDGYSRLCLNGEPYFFNGLLDQGYWQDGIYTPSEPGKFEADILAMKSLGFNTLRKHIKIEHELFYYDCDRLGMVVFQDMVNNAEYSFFHDTLLPTIGITKLSDRRGHKDEETRRIFLESMDETAKLLYNHPSICCWTIFNEGWGQFDADAAYDRLRAIDKSRFIDSTSGWFWQSKSDVDSYHIYFRPVKLKVGTRPLVLSEFGGYSCKLPDHCFNKEKTYGYRKCKDQGVLLRDLKALYEEQILPLVDKGLCAAIYTQVSDVEDETNGLLTYDREVQKVHDLF